MESYDVCCFFPQLPLFQAHPHLKQYVRTAVERAIQEWIMPVVERSLKIALTTCDQIVRKVCCSHFQPMRSTQSALARGFFTFLENLVPSCVPSCLITHLFVANTASGSNTAKSAICQRIVASEASCNDSFTHRISICTNLMQSQTVVHADEICCHCFSVLGMFGALKVGTPENFPCNQIESLGT